MANMNEKLIYDVGMHLGEDAEFYLSKGYKVIAIDADPNLIKLAKSRFASDNGYSGDNVPVIPGMLCHRKQM